MNPGADAEHKGNGCWNSVISNGKEISSTTRATMAGLNRFWPMPPNTCLPISIAIKAPTAPVHQGAQGGNVIASSQPVSSAEPSRRNLRTGLPASFSANISASTAVSSVVRKSSIAGQPNR